MTHTFSLVDANRSLRGRVGGAAVIGVGFSILLAYYLLKYYANGVLTEPPVPMGDQKDYDCIAVQVSKARGFLMDLGDPDFRSPYIRANGDGRYDSLLESAPEGGPGAYPTTYRPPALPAVMAATFRLFGRQFWAIRAVNAAAMAASGALAGWLCFRVAGPLPALACIAMFLRDETLFWCSADVMTESFACLCVTGMACMLASIGPRGSSAASMLFGALAGASILVRTLFALWLPFLAALHYGARRSYAATLVFLASAILVALPWLVRNCAVLGAFMPLGAQGMMELPGGYSDEAMKQHGVWIPHPEFYTPALTDHRHWDTASERRAAELGKSRALAWIKAHPAKLPILAAFKVWKEWKPVFLDDKVLVATSLLGVLLLVGDPILPIILSFLAINTLIVMATWSTSGRFLVPTLPLIHVASGIGAWQVLVVLTERRRLDETAGLDRS